MERGGGGEAPDGDAAGEFLPELNRSNLEPLEGIFGPASLRDELMVGPGDAALAEVEASPGGFEGREDLRAVRRGIGNDEADESAGRAADAEDVTDSPVHRRWGRRTKPRDPQ